MSVSNGYQIDFLSFTLPTGHLPLAMKLLTAFDLRPSDKGLYGYLFSYSAVGCRLLFTPDRPDVHVQLSGRGCDVFDCFSLPANAKITRLDIAFDSYDGAYTVEDVWGCLLQGKTAGTARTIDGYLGFAGKNSGRTVYVGSPKSTCRLRVYDKAAEQGIAADKRIDFKDWSRFELQLRADLAHASYKKIQAFKTLPDHDDTTILANIFQSILKTFFMVCDEVQVKNQERTGKHVERVPSPAWVSMFSTYNHARPIVVRRKPTLKNLVKYVMGAAASYKALNVVFEGFSDMFHDKLDEVEFSEKHEELLIDHAPHYDHLPF